MPPLFPTKQVSSKQVSGVIVCLKMANKSVSVTSKASGGLATKTTHPATPPGSRSPGSWGKTSIAPKNDLPAVQNPTPQTFIDSYHEGRRQQGRPQLSNVPSQAHPSSQPGRKFPRRSFKTRARQFPADYATRSTPTGGTLKSDMFIEVRPRKDEKW